MMSFKFLDEAYNTLNQTRKKLALRKLDAQIYNNRDI